MLRFAPAATALALATAAQVAPAAQSAALDVRIAVPQQVVRGDVDVMVDVTITNVSRHPVFVPKWQLPSDEWEQPLFRVLHEDRTPVKYMGALVKRAAAASQDANEHVRLDPGASVHVQVELTGAYDLSRNGRYTLQYMAKGKQGEVVASQPVYLWLEGRSALPAMAPSAQTDVRAQAASISFTGSCSSSQQTTLRSAVAAATNYANESYSYLNRTPASTQRYVKWFGAMTTTRWNTAKTHYANEANAFANAALTLDCSCKKKTVYAYVYPTQPYKIYVCGAFWNAPMTGTDSKAGTLVHEMSHFNVIAGTDDWAYGQSAAASLAASDPTKALDNADNHEYFAENTPSLP